jgi:hypothetical protein
MFRAPNPASVSHDFTFSLRKAGEVEADLYNVAGQRVARIASGWYAAGDHKVAWQRRTESGAPLASGLYVVRFKSDGLIQSQKTVLVR